MRSGLDEMRKIIREREPLRPSSRLTKELETAKSNDSNHAALPSTVSVPHSAIDRDLDWIVMKCLEKDRARRYETANSLALDLKRHLNNEPVTARPPSTAYRLQKAWRRNKLAYTAGAVVAVALVAGIGVSTWQAVVATQAKSVAVHEQAKSESSQQKAEAEQQRADAQARKASESEQRSRRFLYASDMSLAQQSLNVNDLGQARRLLERHRPRRPARKTSADGSGVISGS